MKTCTKCKIEKPAISEYFYRDKNKKDGLVNACKECRKKYNKKYREENKEEKREYNRKYYQENKEYYREHGKKHYQENKEWYRKHGVKHYQKNKEKYSEYIKKYYQENKEYYAEYSRKYHLENPEVNRLNQQRRRARMAQLPYTLTLEEWEDALEFFDNECAYCGIPEDNLEQEHVIPVVKGGGYTVDNIIPACRTCNSSKNTTDLEEWYVSYRHYDEEKLNKILDYVGIMEEIK